MISPPNSIHLGGFVIKKENSEDLLAIVNVFKRMAFKLPSATVSSYLKEEGIQPKATLTTE